MPVMSAMENSSPAVKLRPSSISPSNQERLRAKSARRIFANSGICPRSLKNSNSWRVKSAITPNSFCSIRRFHISKDEVAAMRRAMPWVRITKDYSFNTEYGIQSLQQLFMGARQLVVYHFMLPPDTKAVCKLCSFWADNFDGGSDHLAGRDTSFVCVSSATLDEIRKVQEEAGWRFKWVSNTDRSFGGDFGVCFGEDVEPNATGYNYTGRVFGAEMPGLSAFVMDEHNEIYHTYSTYGRGLELINGAYQLLDMTALGRRESGPGMPTGWVRRRTEY